MLSDVRIQEEHLTPPHDRDAEEAVVGCILLDGAKLREVSLWLKPEDFYFQRHSVIYSAAMRVAHHNEPVDIVTVSNQLDKDGFIEIVGGRQQLAKFMGDVGFSGNLVPYAKIVREKAQLRALIEVGRSIVEKGYDAATVASDALAEAQRTILAATQDRKMSVFRSANELMLETTSIWESMQSGKAVKGITTGFTALDAVTTGMFGGDLWVLGARPSIGKTALMLNFALNIARGKKPRGVGILSLEMTGHQLMERLMAIEARVPADVMRRGNMTEAEGERFVAAMGPIGDAPIYVDDDPVLDEVTLVAKAQRLVAQHADSKHPIEVLFVDYLQRMRGLARYRGDKRLEVAGQSSALKDVARQMNMPVMVASQLGREVDKRPDKKPMLADLMESGAIEADADVVLLLHRPQFYFPDKTEFQNRCMIIVAKQRRGPTDEVWLGFSPRLTRFRNEGDKS